MHGVESQPKCEDSCFCSEKSDLNNSIITEPGAMENRIENIETDANHNNVWPQKIGLPEAVKTRAYSEIKKMVESGIDLDEVDNAGDTALHVAVLQGHYNTSVLLLNRGCSMLVMNKEGLTARQVAEKMEGRTVFVMAMQLTERSRAERVRKEEKKRLLKEEQERLITEDMDTVESDENDTEFVRKSNKLVVSQESLAAAKNLVTNLETQVIAAKSLVNRLEMDVQNIQRELENCKKKKRKSKPHSQESNRTSVPNTILAPCSVCLDIPRPPLKVFQCPEGHIFCEICERRPELINCPECRVPLLGVKIRNRTMEQLIQITIQ